VLEFSKELVGALEMLIWQCMAQGIIHVEILSGGGGEKCRQLRDALAFCFPVPATYLGGPQVSFTFQGGPVVTVTPGLFSHSSGQVLVVESGRRAKILLETLEAELCQHS
jgi:hypothetical protein